jgi:hypothetical protein
VVDPQRHTVEVRIRAENADHALRPNAFVEVSLAPDPSRRRVRVPGEAVVSDGKRSVVFVTHDAGRLERVPVTVGRRRDGEVELQDRLAPGTRPSRSAPSHAEPDRSRQLSLPCRSPVTFLRNRAAVRFTLQAAWGFSFSTLTTEAFPDPTDTQVNVITVFPGQPAEEVERQIISRRAR